MTLKWLSNKKEIKKKPWLLVNDWLKLLIHSFYWRTYDKWKAVIVKHDDVKMTSY